MARAKFANESLERVLAETTAISERQMFKLGELARIFPYTFEWFTEQDALVDAGAALWGAVVDIWRHTEQHTTFVDGVGYTSRSDQQTCHDVDEHKRLAAAEGRAWRDYRTLAFGPQKEESVG